MKKALVIAILGVASAVGAYAQGHVAVWAYNVAPYNQIMWAPGTVGASGPVVTTDVQLQIWYGAGVVADDSLLTAGVTFTVNPSLDFQGGGYYDAVIQTLPTVGTYTFQLRAFGDTAYGQIDSVSSRSILWQPTNIGSTANPALFDTATPGLLVSVPEPTSFALIGLGSAVMLMRRRRV